MRAGIQVEQDHQRPAASASAVKGSETSRGNERGWLLQARSGDGEAFALLVQAYRAPIYSYLGRCSIDERDRDDLFQDIFLKIYRAAARYEADRPVHPWIFTIVCNTVRNHLRKKRVRQLVFGEPTVDQDVDPADETPDGERESMARQRVLHLERELRVLPRAQREVVLLACVEKMKLGQVAEALDLPVNTVKTHLRRARLALAKALALRDRAPLLGGAEASS